MRSSLPLVMAAGLTALALGNRRQKPMATPALVGDAPGGGDSSSGVASFAPKISGFIPAIADDAACTFFIELRDENDIVLPEEFAIQQVQNGKKSDAEVVEQKARAMVGDLALSPPGGRGRWVLVGVCKDDAAQRLSTFDVAAIKTFAVQP